MSVTPTHVDMEELAGFFRKGQAILVIAPTGSRARTVTESSTNVSPRLASIRACASMGAHPTYVTATALVMMVPTVRSLYVSARLRRTVATTSIHSVCGMLTVAHIHVRVIQVGVVMTAVYRPIHVIRIHVITEVPA